MATLAPAQPTANPQLPSDRRPIPLVRRTDLVVKRIDYRGEPHYVIKDPIGLQYHRLRPEQYALLERLDGQHSLDDLKAALCREFPHVRPTIPDVQHLVQDLHKKNLVQSNRIGQGVELLKREKANRRKKLIASLKNVLYLRLPGWDPEQTLERLYPYTRWLFAPGTMVLAGLLVAAAWLLILINFDTFQSKLPEFQQFFGWPNLMWMWVTLAGAKVFHEFGHGLSCKHYGGECHEMGVMLLVFSPCLYCDVTDSWMLRSKWQRFFIGAAGMYIEVIISALAIFLWWHTQEGLLHHLALNLFFVTTITTVIFNINPLMRFDGYYMLSDLLEIPNLRQKADGMLREKFAKHCLGIELRPDPFRPESGRGWLMFFAIASFLYRWLIIFGIATFLYTVLKPYGLQSIGATLAVASIGSFVVALVMGFVRILKTPRSEPMSRIRLSIFLTVVLVLVALALSIPVPWYVESPLYVQPEGVKHVYVTTPGFVAEVRAQPGEEVSEGDVLVVLENPELEDQYVQVKNEIVVQERRLRNARQMRDIVGEEQAEEELANLKLRRADIEKQLGQLTLSAPVSGTVLPPARKPVSKLDRSDPSLPGWHGTPLEERNQEAWLEPQIQVLSVAPSERVEAVLIIDQGNREELAEGQPVQLRLDHLPGRVYHGKVTDIASRHLEFAPPMLSNKYGGPLPTVTDGEGRERLASIAYEATVPLSKDFERMRSGARGEARVLVKRHTAGDWIWRWIRRTFYFRL